MCTCRWRPAVKTQAFSTLCFETESPPTVSEAHRQAASRTQGSACVHLLGAGITSTCHHAQLFNVASSNWTQVLMVARWQVLLPLPVSTGDFLRRVCAHDTTQALWLEGNKISYHCSIRHPLLSVIQVVPVIGLVCSWSSHIFLMNWICLCVHMGPVCLLKFTGGTVYSQDSVLLACVSWMVMGRWWGLHAQ